LPLKTGSPLPRHAFAKKAGVDVSQLEKAATAKGDYLSAKVTRRTSATEILAELLPKEINAIYWPKSMYWRKPGERFVRPVRWIVALLDGEVIPLEFDGIQAGIFRVTSDSCRSQRRNCCRRITYVEALASAKVLAVGA